MLMNQPNKELVREVHVPASNVQQGFLADILRFDDEVVQPGVHGHIPLGKGELEEGGYYVLLRSFESL